MEPPERLGFGGGFPTSRVGVLAGPRRVVQGGLPNISLVVPVYNEEAAVPRFVERCAEVFAAAKFTYTIVFVDDGSLDSTPNLIDELANSRANVVAVHLSRNFGKEASLSAGLDFAVGDAVVPIDVDLQDPPEVVHEFVEHWLAGYDVVLGVREDRSSDAPLKRWSSRAFYQLMNRISDSPIPPDVGDFRLLDRRVVDVVRQIPDRSRFMKGLLSWAGFPTSRVRYVRPARSQGSSSWSPWRLWNFALDGVTGFSTVPLRMWTYVGFVIAAACLAYAVGITGLALAGGVQVSGYASLLVSVLFIGSVQLISIGLVGEYLARLMKESKGRPVYVVDRLAFQGEEDPWT